MRYTRKFSGPCLDHPTYKLGCGHCNSWRVLCARNPDRVTPHDVQIYRGLHWPAPMGSR